MATLPELIKQNKHRPVRRVYMKRRDTDGNYEASWNRVDVRGKDGTNRVNHFGQISQEIDSAPGEIGVFDVSELFIVFANEDGYFNIETDEQSFWFPDTSYLNRKYTKVKVDCGYLDKDDNEVGVASVFEGFIDRVETGFDQLAKVTVLSYQSIFTRYDISDLSMSGTKSVDTIVNLITNQSKITNYIPYVASASSENQNIANTEDLEGSYWDVLVDLAFKSDSVISLVTTAFAFKPRQASVSSVYDFKGVGSDNNPDIFSIMNYDDEGADRVRVFWKAEGLPLTAQSSDTILLNKYLGAPQIINLDSLIDDTARQSVLDANLASWENPKPVIEFSTRFMVNTISPLDKITIEVLGAILPSGQVFRWDSWSWDDGSLWGRVFGSINILSSEEWMVTRVVKDISEWKTIVRAEKVV